MFLAKDNSIIALFLKLYSPLYLKKDSHVNDRIRNITLKEL
ncbi:hypothetical protein SAMN05421796_1169 [Chryseobacterium piscicola]|uniref:Uncharacterized protein n=1 Tax=Chryseobacterium piscicola TaxID=551459 RepID=A0A1N7PIA9_9FLAO|nr:hypothetical protein SAMN05421796_1169 [Chryseobacterium piscicola]